MQRLKDVRIGDKVWVYSDRRGQDPDLAPVVKVGRKNVHVQVTDWGKPTPYSMEEGYEVRPETARGIGTWVRTNDERVEEEARDEALRRLPEFGLRVNYSYRADKISSSKLKRIIEILEEDPE